MSYYERPPRPERPKRRTFGMSWWGNAWVESVEQLAELNPTRLARGRTYARWNYVGALAVEPGAVRARVAGSRATPYHTWVKVKPFTDTQWDALLTVVASKVGHAAALLDNELTSELVEDAADAGIQLLPAPGELTTGCSCADDANPCKHAAAMCYLIADLLDDDPFVLLQMRGRTKHEISQSLLDRRRRSLSSTSVDAGEVNAKEAFASRTLGALPALAKMPERPGTPVTLSVALPPDCGVDASDLEWLAQSTAQRAWEMCNGIGNSGLFDGPYRDLVRRLAPLLDTPQFDLLCSRSHRIKSSVEADARRLLTQNDEI